MSASVKPALRQEVWERDHGVCGICGEQADPRGWDIDHILPIRYGGPTVVDNLRVAHSSCNRARPKRMSDEDLDAACEEWTANEFERVVAPAMQRCMAIMAEAHGQLWAEGKAA